MRQHLCTCFYAQLLNSATVVDSVCKVAVHGYVNGRIGCTPHLRRAAAGHDPW
jgi:hypothetical protein